MATNAFLKPLTPSAGGGATDANTAGLIPISSSPDFLQSRATLKRAKFYGILSVVQIVQYGSYFSRGEGFSNFQRLFKDGAASLALHLKPAASLKKKHKVAGKKKGSKPRALADIPKKDAASGGAHRFNFPGASRDFRIMPHFFGKLMINAISVPRIRSQGVEVRAYDYVKKITKFRKFLDRAIDHGLAPRFILGA